jgi:hypothetical protein
MLTALRPRQAGWSRDPAGVHRVGYPETMDLLRRHIGALDRTLVTDRLTIARPETFGVACLGPPEASNSSDGRLPRHARRARRTATDKEDEPHDGRRSRYETARGNRANVSQ